MHKKLSKAIVGSLMAAGMLATSMAAVAPMSASAGQLLGQVDFEEGVGLPWHTCETNPAKQSFDISGGTYNVHIVKNNGGNGRWDLQLRHRGLKIVAGQTYTVSGEITADNDGWIYSKIGDYSGETEIWHNIAGQEWQPVQIKKGETFKFKDTFTANQSLDVAEWAFHYADSTGTNPGAVKYNHTDTGFPVGTTIQFDNLSLTGPGEFPPTEEFGVIRPKSNVRLNQVGYYTKLDKKASYVTDAETPLDFEVRDASGKAIYTGKTTVFGSDPDSGTGEKTTYEDANGELLTKEKDSGKNVHIIDFSKVQEPGTYTVYVKDSVGVSGTKSGLTEGAYDTKIVGDKVMWTNWKTNKDYVMNESCKFEISDSVYEGLLTQAMSYYYQNRSGIPIEDKYVSGLENPDSKAPLSHSQYGHKPDEAYVQKEWINTYPSSADAVTSYTVDGTYGWYDAGDHGKYAVNGGVSVWTLQNVYEYSKKLGTDAKWTDGKTVRIPENTNKAPDALDEARVELQWMMDMQVSASDPFWGSKCEGMVYHKLHDQKWTGLAIHAWSYEEDGFKDCVRIAKPPTYAASFNLAACGAQAARLWKDFDSDFADKALAAAEKAYAAVKKSGTGYTVASGSWKTDPQFAPLDQAIGGGPYGDTYVMDDMYWAACELYITTGKEEYLKDLEAYTNPNDSSGTDKAYSLPTYLGGGENKGSLSSFNWGCTSGLGTLSLYLNQDKLTDANAKKVTDSIVSAGDLFTDTQSKQGMGIPYVGSTFEDDVNIGAGIKVTGYEWGSNSFVINNAIVMAYAYDATKEMKYINGASEALDYIFGRNGLDFSYVSGWGETTLTYPHHRFWSGGIDPKFPLAPKGILSGGPGAGMQDPYIGGLGYKRGTLANQKCYVDSAEAWSVNEITINWNAPLVWMSSFMDDVAATVDAKPSEKVWGDADVSGEVTVSDVVCVLQYSANKTKYPLKNAQALDNADCNADGDVNATDAYIIQQLDAGVLKQSDMPYKK